MAEGSGYRAHNLGFRPKGCEVKGFKFTIQGLGSRVYVSGLKLQSL
jgi:hypothetical protein